MTTKAYSYIRFSSKVQASGDSLRRQTELAEKWALENNLELDTRTYRDLGVSAFGNSEMEGLNAFLRAIDSGRIKEGEYLIVESLDRLSRNPDILEAVELFLSIVRKGVILVTLSDGYTYNKADLDVMKLIVSISILARASNESKVKSDRLKASWENKRRNISQKPMTGRCPAWLTISGDRSEFVIVKDRVELLNRIYKMSRDGIGKNTIVKTLNSEKIPTWSNTKRKTKGWQESYVHKLLTNRAVLGFHTPTVKGEDGTRKPLDEVSNYFPAVIPEELFYSVQRARKARIGGRKGANYVNLFQGLCYCSSCGARMRLINKGGVNPKKIGKRGARYYQCDEAVRLAGCKERGKIYHSELESTFLKYCSEIDWSMLRKDTVSTQERLRDEIHGLTEKLKQYESKLQKIQELMLVNDDIATLANAAKQIEIDRDLVAELITEKEKTLQTALAETERKFEASILLGQLKELVTLEDRAKASEIIKLGVNSIIMHPSGKPRPYYRINLADGDYRIVFYLDNSSTGLGEITKAAEEELIE